MNSNYKEVENWKKNHTGVIQGKISPGTILLIAENGDTINASIPYDNGFCIQPVTCAGLNSCPRNYSCSE